MTQPAALPPVTVALLDTAAVHRLRVQAGYSVRRLARALGTSATTIRGIEDGSNHHQLPLSLIDRLANALGTTTPELFPRPTAVPALPGDDDRTIETALHSLDGIVAISDLARALGWSLDRTRAALEALDTRLHGTGSRLHRNAWQQCALRPAAEHLSIDQQHALQRIGPRRRGLTNTTARVLMASARGEIDDHWFRTASNADCVALQALLKQGAVITRPGKSQIVPAPDVAYALDPALSRPPVER